jgi:nucleoside-diphosphate-sugar epimerase
MARLEGDLLVLGAGGKMGPSLVRLAQRATTAAGVHRSITAVSRFHDTHVRGQLEELEDVETIAADLLEPGTLAQFPDAPNVVFMAGQKFGTSEDPAATWSLNAFLPGLVMRRFTRSRVVVLSTGNVYPLVDTANPGCRETDPLDPSGEYAQSAVARERIVTYFSELERTPTTIIRLNYAVELRYGVLRDLADRIMRGEPVDLTMGYVNVIWQRDANAIALRSLEHCSVPPLILNVTGPEKLQVRVLAEQLGAKLGTAPTFANDEADTALLSDASRCWELFGPPTADVRAMMDWVAGWVRMGGSSLQKPTHFEEREGRF